MCFKNNIAIAAQGDSINITIPSKLDIKLNSDGSNTLNNFTVQNQSLVPITINNINLIKNADWNIVPSNVSIPKDTKQISLSVEGKELALGDNTHSIIVPYGDNRVLNISLKRGLWTKDTSSPDVFSLNFDYEIGKREFLVNLDTNGGSVKNNKIIGNNGDILTLPVPVKENCKFLCWKDEKGVSYNDKYIVPIGASLLIAQWKQISVPEVMMSGEDFCKTVEVKDAKNIEFIKGIPNFDENNFKKWDISEKQNESIYMLL